MKRHTKPARWPFVAVILIAALVSGLAAGFIAAYPAISMTSSLLTENIRLAEQLEWYAAIHRDRIPLDVVGLWQ